MSDISKGKDGRDEDDNDPGDDDDHDDEVEGAGEEDAYAHKHKHFPFKAVNLKSINKSWREEGTSPPLLAKTKK